MNKLRCKAQEMPKSILIMLIDHSLATESLILKGSETAVGINKHLEANIKVKQWVNSWFLSFLPNRSVLSEGS